MEQKKGQILNIVIIVLAAIFLILVLKGGFNLRSLFVVILWFVYFKLRETQNFFQATFNAKHILVVFLLTIFSFTLVPLKTVKKSGSNKVISSKIYGITSENSKLKGQIKVETYKSGKVSASYFILINDNYAARQYCRPEQQCLNDIEYTYALDLVEDEVDDEGALLDIYCNKGNMPANPFDYEWEFYSYRNCDANPGQETTDSFVAEFTLGFDSEEEFFATTTLNTHEATKYFYIESQEIDGNSTSTTYAVDYLKAITNEPVFASYNLEIKEIK